MSESTEKLAPDRIWLIRQSEYDLDWCDCPDPSDDIEPEDVVAYVKATRIAELEAERDALLAKLVELASIAHHGGLTGHDSNDIRRLTLPFWDMAECARLQEQSE